MFLFNILLLKHLMQSLQLMYLYSGIVLILRNTKDASGGYFGLAFVTTPPPRIERFWALTL